MTTTATKRPTAIRSLRERVIQTVWFELVGPALVAPPFAYFSGASAGDSFALLLTLALVVALWSGLYNSTFDRVEARLTGRVASARPHGLRVLHAVGLEASAILLTWPLIMAFTPLGWWQALFADIGLTLAYIAYGYVFHLVFDRLQPVCP